MIDVKFKDLDLTVWYQPMGHPAFYCRRSINRGWEVKLEGLWQKLPASLPFSESDLEEAREHRICDLLEGGGSFLISSRASFQEISEAPESLKCDSFDGNRFYYWLES